MLVELRPQLDDASGKIWYLDDGTIFGSLELLEQVLLRLEQNLPSIGLELNLRKPVLVSSERSEASRFAHLADATHVDIREENQGFKVHGVPRKPYVKKALEEPAEGCSFLRRVSRVRTSKWVRWNLPCGASTLCYFVDTKQLSALAEAVNIL